LARRTNERSAAYLKKGGKKKKPWVSLRSRRKGTEVKREEKSMPKGIIVRKKGGEKGVRSRSFYRLCRERGKDLVRVNASSSTPGGGEKEDGCRFLSGKFYFSRGKEPRRGGSRGGEETGSGLILKGGKRREGKILSFPGEGVKGGGDAFYQKDLIKKGIRGEAFFPPFSKKGGGLLH